MRSTSAQGKIDGLLFLGDAPKNRRVKAIRFLIAIAFIAIFSGRADEVRLIRDPATCRAAGEQKGSMQILAIHGSAKMSYDKGWHWSVAREGERVREHYA